MYVGPWQEFRLGKVLKTIASDQAPSRWLRTTVVRRGLIGVGPGMGGAEA